MAAALEMPSILTIGAPSRRAERVRLLPLRSAKPLLRPGASAGLEEVRRGSRKMPCLRLSVTLIGALLLMGGCARSAPSRQTADVAPQPVAQVCESALGEAIAPGLMTARTYALANLAHRAEETRYALLGRGVRRFQIIRHAVRCKPYSVIYSAGRMYRCTTSAHVCARA